MKIHNKLNQIRYCKDPNLVKKPIYIIYSIVFGIILGLLSKFADIPNISPIFSDITGRLGIWIFIATILSTFNYSPKLAAINVFVFFISLIITYYIYTILILNFFPKKVIVFWSLCALISPICAYIMWYSIKDNLFSYFIASGPIALLISEGFELHNAYLPVHQHYYLIPFLQIIYIIMISVLLLLFGTNKKKFIIILLLSIIISFAMIKFNILFLIFGGMNTVL